MQNNRVWERACGLIRTVGEGVRFDDKTDAIIVSVRPDARARSRCGRCGRRSPGYDRGDVGVLSTLALPECLSRLMLQESGAEPMVRRLLRFLGRDTTLATPATSTRWRPGSLSEPRRVRPVNSFGWRGGPSGRSSPGSTTTSKPVSTVLGVCVGSGSTRSPTKGDTVT